MQKNSINHLFVSQAASFVFVLLLLVSCNSKKAATTTTNNEKKAPREGQRGERPSTAEIFKMDTNGDGKLSKSEVKGPLERDFAKIDSNGDGFISKTELENAPKPEHGQRPPRG